MHFADVSSKVTDSAFKPYIWSAYVFLEYQTYDFCFTSWTYTWISQYHRDFWLGPVTFIQKILATLIFSNIINLTALDVNLKG